MTKITSKLLAAASGASGSAMDMIEDARDGEIRSMGNVGAGETLTQLADSLRLLIDAMRAAEIELNDSENQLHGALGKFLDDRA